MSQRHRRRAPQYAKQTDQNENSLVDFFERVGQVERLSAAVGGGVPDLLLGIQGLNLLVEVKRDGTGLSKPPRSKLQGIVSGRLNMGAQPPNPRWPFIPPASWGVSWQT